MKTAASAGAIAAAERLEITRQVYDRFASAMEAEGRPIRPAADRGPDSLAATMCGYKRPPADFQVDTVFEAAACRLEFEPAKKPEPSAELPGTAGRIAIYRRRLERGEIMFYEGDDVDLD